MENAILGLDVKNVGSEEKKVKRIVATVGLGDQQREYELSMKQVFPLKQNVPAMFYIVVEPFEGKLLSVKLYGEDENTVITEKNTGSVQTIEKGHCLQMGQITIEGTSSK